MTFTTLTFIVFLCVVFPTYWYVKKRSYQNILLLATSYFFYGWWDYRFCLLMLGTSLLDYAAGLAIFGAQSTTRRRLWLVFNLACNLGVLGFFKYFNFFANNFQLALGSVGWRVDPVFLKVILPAGISFYTFQAMSYTIDIYRDKLEPTRKLVEYLAFISFFPHLVAGPIMRAAHLLPQFMRHRRFDYGQATEGCRQILWGFFKKLVIADNLYPIVDQAYSNPTLFTGPQLAFATICFAFEIYCDFSAYSDIAIGTAKLFGFTLMRNFAYPYFSQSMGEFWRRWHISLSTWFRDYLYIPLGGSRGSRLEKARNVMVTFLLSGLWHGASWNFLIWGGINGLAVLPETMKSERNREKVSDVPGGMRLVPNAFVAARIAFTFVTVCLAWIFFRAQTLSEALTILQRIVFGVFQIGHYKGILDLAVASPLGRKVILLPLGLTALEWIHRDKDNPLCVISWPEPARWLAYSGLLWASLYWGAQGARRFIYFQF